MIPLTTAERGVLGAALNGDSAADIATQAGKTEEWVGIRAGRGLMKIRRTDDALHFTPEAIAALRQYGFDGVDWQGPLSREIEPYLRDSEPENPIFLQIAVSGDSQGGNDTLYTLSEAGEAWMLIVDSTNPREWVRAPSSGFDLS